MKATTLPADEPLGLLSMGVSDIVAPQPAGAQGSAEARNGITWHL
ncbi:hypothetical protein ACSVIJ_20215 [Pseudomonas sp. NCHU5208]